MRENCTYGSVRGSRQAVHVTINEERNVETVYSTIIMTKMFLGVALSSLVLFFCSSCENLVGYDYVVKQRAELTNLLVFYYGPNIVGIDTTDFTVRAHMRVADMSFGGVAKLPSGGIAFTHHRRASNNAWGNTLYVTDKNCNLLNTYTITDSPMTPKVINNLLLIGSSAIDSGVTFNFQIYDTDNFNLKREYQFRDMVDAWQITTWNNDKAYFGIRPTGNYPSHEYSYVVELDLNTLDTTVISKEIDFFSNDEVVTTGLAALRHESLLYIFNVLEKKICIYDLSSRTVKHVAKVREYPQIAALETVRLVRPYFHNNFLYGQLAYNNSQGTEISYLAKFDPISLELVEIISLEVHRGYIRGAHQFYMGNYLVRQFERNVTFTNIETGRTEHNVALDVAY